MRVVRDVPLPTAVDPEPAAPRGCVRARAAVGLVLVGFVSGAVAGAVGGVAVLEWRIRTFLSQPEKLPDRVVEKLRSELDLSDEQARRVEAIVRERHTALMGILGEVRPRVDAELRRIEEDVAEVLDDGQRLRWRAEMREVRGRAFPLPPPG